MTVRAEVHKDDCLNLLRKFSDESVDLVYMDPPFFTEKVQSSKNRERTREFSYSDLWGCHEKYAKYLSQRILEMKRTLKSTGSIFIHCDKNATHVVRALLDDVFGRNQFRSEIIWTYKRWSNAKRSLLPAHQTIYFYTKTDQYKFRTVYNGYSESTNIDQLLQKRTRDTHGKAIYARDENQAIILDDEKEGVPLSDVWDIPYLNPKARERVGYPTQKPISLLERIITISTDSGDTVLDPFCGSGTTLVAAKLLMRNSVGVDISDDAVELAKERLEKPIKSDSPLMQKGRDTYLTADEESLSLLRGLDLIPVQRNKGIDAILRQQYEGTPILLRVQKQGEPLAEAAKLLSKAAKKKGAIKAVLVRTEQSSLFSDEIMPDNISVVDSTSLAVNGLLHHG